MPVFLLIKANLVAQHNDNHAAEKFFNLLLRFAVGSASAFNDFDSEQAAIFRVEIPLQLQLCLVDAPKHAFINIEHVSLQLLDWEELRVRAGKTNFFLSARVACQFLSRCRKILGNTVRAPDHAFELNFAVFRVDLAVKRIVIVSNPERYVKALLGPKNITFAEVVLLNRLDDVRAFPGRQNIDLVARVGDHEEGHDERAKGAHLRRHLFSVLVHSQTE